MKIIPNRTMRLEGERVEAGKVSNVSQKAGELALRHGWASLAPTGAKPEAKVKEEN